MKITLGIVVNPFEKIACLKKYWDLLKKKLQDYSDPKEAREWFKNNLSLRLARTLVFHRPMQTRSEATVCGRTMRGSDLFGTCKVVCVPFAW